MALSVEAPVAMAKQRRKGAAAGPAADVDVAALQAEVRALSSQLGLASTSGGQGFDDSDFRPEKAQVQLGTAGGRNAKNGQDAPRKRNNDRKKFKWTVAAEGEARRKPLPGNSDHPGKELQREAAAAAPEARRQWNAGAGALPGEADMP
jgi:hypothetical protein